MSHPIIKFSCIKVKQPIGEFYIASIDSDALCKIAWADIRRIEQEEEREVTKYLGIQRPLSDKRVKEIKEYVKSVDACFPTSVILAIEKECVAYNDKNKEMELFPIEETTKKIPITEIAKILDGQHRLAGLKDYVGEPFEINVSIFVDIDLATQANIFATVNLAQTKVNKSLVYDLFDLSKKRSPQKSCHLIAVSLDQYEKSPFYKKIKRLGVATEGRYRETITQATFVDSLMPFISNDPQRDRDLILRNKKIEKATAEELQKMLFRNMFLEEKDLRITDILLNYFEAIQKRWPRAWANFGEGNILNKTNGFKALMRFLRPLYLYLGAPGDVPKTEQVFKVFQKIKIKDDEFTVDTYKPGTSGESQLFNDLLKGSGLLIS